ncbi:glycosyl hydrolase family 61-domain-containing protein [Crucibulum laeve]|uniref:AA9 family lytic polysaccharide monooxygenase n=1 Tax=Crucibulum laeve TaxID=68775 RepID=A0A5C3LLQ2_9AGAR|nr:glycosyl hydrolase family 61-domain-containing protein [Crucibulum laeve]
MQLTQVLALASVVATAVAHTTVYGVWINGVFQGDGRNVYIRSPPSNYPVKDLKSSAMACNVNNRVVSQSVSVKSGDQLTFEWYHDSRNDDIIENSHKGPVQVYMAPSSGTSWTKIFSDSYGGTWAVDRLIAARGQHGVIIPNVPAGDYLLRAEILGLHEADTLYSQAGTRGIQVYPSCVQIKVTSSGSQSLPGGTSFPGTYTDSTPGIQFNLYKAAATSYQAPGPAVWSGAAGGSIGKASAPPTSGGGSTGGGSGGASGSVALYGQCGGVSH